MTCRHALAATLIAAWTALPPAPALAACEPVRVAYLDQHRPPYWLGSGPAVPAVPGASVELIQRFAASAGCGTVLKRMPVLRIRHALETGEVDFAPMAPSAQDTPAIVFPTDKEGRADTTRAVPIYVVVFARASDHLPRDVDTHAYFQGRLLGLTLGSSYAERLQKNGFQVDTGALDVARNFEKLRLHRIDGFAVSLTQPDNMDSYIKQTYAGAIVRLRQPLLADHMWLAVSSGYYDAHRARVEAMWDWLGASGNTEFSALLDKYTGGR